MGYTCGSARRRLAVPAQIDPQRALIVLVLLSAGMSLPTLLVRPGPRGSERLESERDRQRRRRWALRGMWRVTLVGLCSGLAGGLLQSTAGARPLALLLHALFRVCWLPAYLLRGLEEALAGQGVALDSELPGLLGLLLTPGFWFSAFFIAGRWVLRRG